MASQSKALWTPDRDISLDGRKRTVVGIKPAEMKAFALMDRVARTYNIVLACEFCRRPFHGRNSPDAREMAVECDCRELRARMPSAIVGG